MNKSDFISDAVALDLGKSGVKVAETLEIEVGNEWWRLINSENTSTVQVFQNRQKTAPIISGGQLHLGEWQKKIGPAGHNYNMRTFPTAFMAYKETGEGMSPYYVTVYQNKTDGKVPFCKVFNAQSELVNTITSPYGASSYSLRNGFWDHVNQRILSVVLISNTRWTFWSNLDGTIFAYAGQTSGDCDFGYGQPKVFPETPECIYILFKQNNVLKIKKITPTLGMNAHSLAISTTTSSGSTSISVASCRPSEADVFYSRKHESVGVAWVDTTTGNLFYALESEDWGTAHFVSQVTAEDGVSLYSFGNLVLPTSLEGGGEYFIAGLRKKTNGDIVRPTGYTFPTNLSIMGACRGTETDFRLFGYVNNIWYIYTVSYENMAITNVTSPYDVGFSPSSTAVSIYAPVKIADSETRELFIVQVYGKHRTQQDSRAAILICYDKSSSEIVWVWGVTEWSNSNLFPSTYSSGSSWRQQILQRIANKVLVLQAKNQMNPQASVFLEHYVIDLSTALTCNTSIEFQALMTNRHIVNGVPLADNSGLDTFALRPQGWQNTSISWDEGFETYAFPLGGFTQGASEALMNRLFYLNKLTWDFVSIKGYYWFYDDVFPSVGAVEYIQEDKIYNYNVSAQNDKLDTHIRFFKPTTSMNFLSDSFVNVRTITNIAGGVPVIVATNVENSTFYPSASGTNIYLSGACFDGGIYSVAQRLLPIPHTFSKYMVSEFENVMLFLGQVVNGEIPYTKMNCLEADTSPSLLIDANDHTKTYFADKGFNSIGGDLSQIALGSWVLYVDITGMLTVLDIGTSLDEGMGGIGEPSGGGVTAYAYNYLNQRFYPYPFAREGIKVELSNISKMTKITLPETQTDLIRTMLASGTDFRGSRCILRRIFPDHSDEEGSDIVLLDGYIQDWSYSPEKKGILFTVSKTLIDVGASFPKRLMNMGCSHVFKGVRCGYLGEDGICTKTKTDCTSKGTVTRFGGFPWVAARQRRVMWR